MKLHTPPSIGSTPVDNFIDTIDDTANVLHTNAISKGFAVEGCPRPIGDLCSLLHSEISELFEAYRKGKLFEKSDKDIVIHNRAAFLSNAEEELADIIIRALQTAREIGIHSIGTAVVAKHLYNTARPYRHGDKIV